ncbi:carboxypeptidase-like regulatory domain-containing protein [Leptospira jelokensis]|uniref:carboxypeptidase-like regulatory domain-containing protein n=1 Tax=Leptospira jelokensis TaxID=2484931 RepID=UPI001090D4E1|nr:carboxypeptidase-like regulatory domain-containing protein [Leptospira jelokensis]TGM05528.1 carboxypeptidase regulatory-like domain-containing protein [Leptospira jelokensis]
MKRILHTPIILFFSLTVSNCYFNPLVNSLLNPTETEENSLLPGLSLLSISGAPYAISLTGQIRNENGATVNDALLTVTSRSNDLDGLDASATTDAGGRFFIRLATGTTTFAVTQDESPYFSFTLRVNSPTDIQVVDIRDNSFPVEVSSFFPFDPGNQPSFFEMVDSDPTDQSVTQIGPSAFYFYFTSPPAQPIQGQEAIWLSQNISVSPSLTLSNLSFEVNSMIVLVFGYSSQTTTYSITLGSGILSETGIPLTPRTISFTCETPCGL